MKSHAEIKKQLIDAEEPLSDHPDIANQYELSQLALEGYVMLDSQHYAAIQSIIEAIRTYARDSSRRRPLNIILHAEPGSGKSHFVKCLAKKLSDERIKEVTFNMSSMRSIEDLAYPIDVVRDVKVTDRLPLLFLDEFDSSKENFARLLPLLWDGEIDVGNRLLQTGKMIVILAGSGKRVAELMSASKKMDDATKEEDGKLKDLLSRINGGEISIPSLDETKGERDRRVDKVCLAISLLRMRFGRSLTKVPWALLRFIAMTHFQHGARSMTNLIDLIPSPNGPIDTLQFDDLHLPLSDESTFTSSNLVYHIAASNPAEVVNLWKSLMKRKTLVTCAYPENFVSRLVGHLLKEPFFKH